MDWLRKLQAKKSESVPITSSDKCDDSSAICLEAFNCHWLQICEVITATIPKPAFEDKEVVTSEIDNITLDDVDTVQNLFEQMILLVIEEQCSGQVTGPVLEYAINKNVFQKICDWWRSSSMYKEEIMRNLLKLYEVLISQAQHSLLHHKQILTPMLQLLSYTNEHQSEELDGHVVILLNLLCVWLHRDPTLLDVFFTSSNGSEPAQFLIFSLLIEYIHREGAVGQQARDALLLCMALSIEKSTVASYIVEHSSFCPVLATGLSALYSTLPRQLEVRAEGWHSLQKSDWSNVPELNNFMNSLDFCNSVVEVSHTRVSDQLLDYFYNGFLVSVFGPSLHKTSAEEVVVTTAYLNLFLHSVSAPGLMRCFLRFLLTHRHENSLIINTLIKRIASGSRLALVSLSLIRTLVDLNCEDLMLQLVFRYLMPCQHILASQRRAICDVDMYNASAARFLALTPAVCVLNQTDKNEEEILLPIQKNTAVAPLKDAGNNESEVTSNGHHGNGAFHCLAPPLSVHDRAPIKSSFYRKSTNHSIRFASGLNRTESGYSEPILNNQSESCEDVVISSPNRPRTITSPSTMAEFGPDLNSQLELNTSYMDYLEDARIQIDQCREACAYWSAHYDGSDPIDTKGIESESIKPSHGSVPPIQSPHQLSHNRTNNCEPNLDLQHTHTSDAMNALSATYQALNSTAMVFNQTKLSFSHLEKPVSDASKPTNDALEVNSGVKFKQVTEKEILQETLEANKIEEKSSSDTGDCSSAAREENVKPLSSADTTDERAIDNTTQLDSKVAVMQDHELISKKQTTTSSVDEFFRSLMEIVPKTTREKVEANRNAKTVEQRASEEDIESGIEVSSDGDPQSVNREQTRDDNDGSRSPLNEDTMSQLSLNSDEIEGGNKNSLTDLHQDDIDNSRTYSNTDDEDNEFADTLSITSSSFYEASDEYGPIDISVGPATPLKLQGIPYTGPLIGNLFAKLDQMVCNTLHENLLLTGIVTRLAVYPHPLLRSFLLNTHMVFHPSVRSLYQVLKSAGNKIDSFAEDVTDFRLLVRRAQKFFMARGTYPFSSDARTRNVVKDLPMPVPRVKTKILGGMFKRMKTKEQGKKKSLLPSLETLLERRHRSTSKDSEDAVVFPQGGSSEHASAIQVRQRNQQREEGRKMKELRTRNAVYASIVLAEFLKELAAVAQEHAVTQV